MEGNFNTAIGAGTLVANTALRNTAIGAGALLSNTTGCENTANGAFALINNTVGNFNTANGAYALSANTAGSGNSAVGHLALYLNETGTANNAFGKAALESNVDGSSNNAIGDGALGLNESGDGNTAVGNVALASNTASGNTAVGGEALGLNTTGTGNTAVGFETLLFVSDAGFNTAVGYQALVYSEGPSNSALGYLAMGNTMGAAAGNTAIGREALLNTTGNDNVAVRTGAGMSQDAGSGNVYIGSGIGGVAGESNHTYVRNIDATTVSGGGTDTVTVNLATGLLGHLSSSRRYKEEIQPMDDASETLYRLKPVTFRYKKEIDANQVLDYGLVAEDVADVDADLVMRDKNGQVESVRYTAVNAMLLNEFLKEHRRVEELKSAMAQQRKGFRGGHRSAAETTEALVARLNEQEARIQKVSAKVEMRKSGSQMLVENQ